MKKTKENFVEVKLKLDPADQKRVSKVLSKAATASFDLVIYVIKKKYDIFQNPLYVWEAIRFCINQKKQFPSWVLDYLSEAGNHLLVSSQPCNVVLIVVQFLHNQTYGGEYEEIYCDTYRRRTRNPWGTFV